MHALLCNTYANYDLDPRLVHHSPRMLTQLDSNAPQKRSSRIAAKRERRSKIWIGLGHPHEIPLQEKRFRKRVGAELLDPPELGRLRHRALKVKPTSSPEENPLSPNLSRILRAERIAPRSERTPPAYVYVRTVTCACEETRV